MYTTPSRLRVTISRRLLLSWQPLRDKLSHGGDLLGEAKNFGTRKHKPKSKKKEEDVSQRVVKLTKKKRKPRASPAGIVSKPGGQEEYKNLVYKWMLEAYPESLSRMEISGRLHAHPQRVKTLIIKPLCEDGRIFKWGQKVTPYERYMPNVKAPEYYEVTGETPPRMPNINEQEFLQRMHPTYQRDPRRKHRWHKPAGQRDPTEQRSNEDGDKDNIVVNKAWSDLYEPVLKEEEEADSDEEEEMGMEAIEVRHDGEGSFTIGEIDDGDDIADLSASDDEDDTAPVAEANARSSQRHRRPNGERFQNGAPKRLEK